MHRNQDRDTGKAGNDTRQAELRPPQPRTQNEPRKEEPVLEKWKAHHKKVRDQTEGLIVNQHIFKEVKAIIAANSTAAKPSSFHPWLTRLYVDSSVTGVRRVCDRRKGVVSLWNLLESIRQNNELLGIDRHVRMWTEDYGTEEPWVSMAKRDFERECGRGHVCLPKSRVREDMNVLRLKTTALEDYANRTVAHLAAEEPATIPTFGDLEEALACIEKIVIRYGILLNGSESQPLLPVWQYDWSAIFIEFRKSNRAELTIYAA